MAMSGFEREVLRRISELEARVLGAKSSAYSSQLKQQFNTLMDGASGGVSSSDEKVATTLTTNEVKKMVAQAALTATWNQVTGDAKPADGATVNNVFMQDDEPSHSLCEDMDLWIDTNDNNHLYRYDLATDTFVSAKDGNIAALGDDGIITPLEKLLAKQEWDTIVVEGNASTGLLVAKAVAIGKSHSTFDSAYAALDTYLNTTLTVFADMDANTTVTRATWDTKWKDYYDARTALVNSFVGAVGGLDLVTGNYVSLAPTIAATVGSDDLSCIYCTYHGYEYPPNNIAFVGTKTGKIYKSIYISPLSFSLNYDTTDATERINKIVEFGADFYAVTNGGSGYGRLLKSVYPYNTWTVAWTSTHTNLRTLAASDSIMVIGSGGDGSGAHIYSTTDGSTVTSRLTSSGYEIYDIAYLDGYFCGVVGGGGTDRIYYSSSGITWFTGVSTATTTFDCRIMAYNDIRTGLNYFVIPYLSSGTPGVRVVSISTAGLSTWTTEVVGPMDAVTSFNLIEWQGTCISLGVSGGDPLRKRIWRVDGTPVWEDRLLQPPPFLFSGEYAQNPNRIIYVSGEDNYVYQLSELQLLAF